MISTIVEIEHLKDFDEQGFYSRTYLAIDKRLNRQVAVKDIFSEHLTSDADFEKHFSESLKLEYSAHPRILPVYYVGIDRSGTMPIPRIVTKYFKNGSLNSRLEKTYASNRTLDLDEVIRYAHDVIQAMTHLHALDIVHLDLKASNLYIGDDNKLLVGDFGKAQFIADGIIFNPRDIYPAITPSEASEKKAIDKTADIFQFGLLLYSMLCYDKYRQAITETFKISTHHLKEIYRQNLPNRKELKALFNQNIKAFKKAVDEELFPDRKDYPFYVPDRLKEIIHKCLATDVADRYQNFYQIQADLNGFIFPKGVTNLYQDLTTKDIHFTKDDKPCVMTIALNGQKFDITSKKNDRTNNNGCETSVSSTKLNKVLFNLISEI